MMIDDDNNDIANHDTDYNNDIVVRRASSPYIQTSSQSI